MLNLKDGKYSSSKQPDARGFSSTLEIEVEKGEVVSANLDATNPNPNPYGSHKSTSERYNNEMFAESGTYYRDAVSEINSAFESGELHVDVISGATVISQEANELMNNIITGN